MPRQRCRQIYRLLLHCQHGRPDHHPHCGWLLKHVSYSVLFLYSAIFVALAFFTMLMVRHGDVKVEAKRGLEAFDVDD